MRIKFAVDLDAEKSRNRARNHDFSDFGCFIEFSVPGHVHENKKLILRPLNIVHEVEFEENGKAWEKLTILEH